MTEDEGVLGLDDSAWGQVLEASYVHSERDINWSMDVLKRYEEPAPPATESSSRHIKIWLVLKALSQNHCQFAIDGARNIWILKAPEACKGVGIKLLHKLGDILECEKGFGGRTAQKYIETPLLAPYPPAMLSREPSSR